MGAEHRPVLARGETWEAGAVAALLLYFAGRIAYFALNLDPAVPPDELTHMARVHAFADSWTIPNDTAALAATGYVPSDPYLYYWLAARLTSLNPGAVSDLVFLRLISGALGLATVLYGYWWVRHFVQHRITRVLFVLMLTNTLMFTIVCATVSYDALVNLCAAAALYHLTRFVNERSATHLLAVLLFLGLGGLTKLTLLPFAVAVIVCILIRVARDFAKTRRKWARYWPDAKWPAWLLAAAVVVCVLLNALLYGGNLLRYGKPVPSPEQVYDEQTILSSPIWARNVLTERYRAGEITFDEAVAQANLIRHDATRRDTLALLVSANEKQRTGYVFTPLPLYRYLLTWVQMIGERTFGILAHENALKEGYQLLPYLAVALVALYQLILQWRPRRQERFENYALFIVAFYTLVVLYFVNYRAYLSTEEIVMTVQGRYLFPVAVPFYGLIARYYLDYWPPLVRWILSIAVAAIFLYGDLPHFLLHADLEKFLSTP